MSDIGGSAEFVVTTNVEGLVQAGHAGQQAFEGLEGSAKRMASTSDAAIAKMSAQVKGLAENIAKAGKAGAGPSVTAQFNAQAKAMLAAQRQVLQSQRAADAQALVVARAAGKEQAEAAKTAGTQQRVAAQQVAQQAIIATRESAQKRVALTRGAVDSMVTIEKGLGRAIQGTASTVVAGTRRLFAGIVGSVQRSFAERHQIISGGLTNELHIFSDSAAREQAVVERANRGITGSLLRTGAIFGGGFALFNQFKSVFTLGSDFSTGLRVLQTQLGLTDKQMVSIRQTAIDLGNDIRLPGISALDAAQGIQIMAKQFTQLGSAAPAAAQATARAAIQLGLAVKASTEDAAAGIGAAVNVFKVPVAQATKAADILAESLAKSAGIGFTDFKEAFVQAAPVVASFLVPIEGATGALGDYNTALAILAKNNIIGQQAGAGLKQLFIQGTKLTKDGEKSMTLLIKKAGESGTAFFTASGKARPFAQTLDILRRGLAGFTQEQRNAALGSIFGSRSITTVNALLNTSTADYLKLQAAIRDSTGAADKFAQAQKIGVARALDGISSSIDTAKIKLFELLTGGAGGNGPLAKLALGFADVFDKLLNDGSPAFTAVRRGLLGVAAGLAAVAAAKVGVEVLQLLATTVPLLFTPMGALIAAAGGLGAAFFLIEGRGKSFQELMKQIQTDVTGLAQRGIKDLQTGLAKLKPVFEQDVLPALERLRTLAGEGLGKVESAAKSVAAAVTNFLRPAFQKLLPEVQAVFRLFASGNFAAAGKQALQVGKDILSGIGNAVSQIDFSAVGKAITSKLGLAITGAVAAGGIGFALGGPLGAALALGIAGAFALALPKIRSFITGIDVPSLFGKFLDGVRKVGETISKVLFDKRTLLAAAGIGAAAVAIAGQFVAGLVQGLIAKIPDIASALTTIFESAFKLPSIAQSILALLIVFRKVLIGGIQKLRPDAKSAGTQVGVAAGEGVVDGIRQGAQQQGALNKVIDSITARLAASNGGAARFAKTGIVLGGALVQGLKSSVRSGIASIPTLLSSVLAGSALGTASSGLEKGLALGGIAASAGQAFAAGGTAAAAASVGVSVLSAALSANAQKHQDAAAAADKFSDAVSKEDVGSTIFSDIQSQSVDVQSDLDKAGFKLKDFQDALQSGRGAEFLAGIKKQLLDLTPNKGLLSNPFGGPKQSAAFNFLIKEVKAYAAGVDIAGAQADIAAGKADEFGSKTGKSALAAVNGIRGLASALIDANAAAASDAIQKRVEADKVKIDALGDAADTAAQKLHDLLFPPSTGKEAATKELADLPNQVAAVQSTLSSAAKGIIGKAQIDSSITDFKNNLKGAIESIATDPSLTAAAKSGAIANLFKDVKLGLGGLELPADTESTLLGAVDSVAKQVSGKSFVQVQTQLDAASAAKTTAETQATLDAAGIKITVPASPDVPTATATGQRILTAVGQAAAAGVTIPSTYSVPDAAAAGAGMASTAAEAVRNSPDLSSEGANLSTSFAGGILSQLGTVVKAAAQVAQNAKNAVQGALIIGSPSKVFIKIGQETMQGFAIGLKDGSSDVVQTAQDIAQGVIDTSFTAAQRLAQSQTAGRETIFSAIFGSTAVQANQAFEQARAAITSNFATLRGQVQQNGIAILQAAQVKPGERTLADLAALQAKPNSLSLTDQFGIANRSAIAQAVSAVQDFGKALIEQGNPIASVVKQLTGYRDILIATAEAAGLSKSGAAQLIDSLGLSQARLSQFLAFARQAGIEINAGAATKPPAAPAPPPPLKPGVNPVQQLVFNEGAIQITTDHKQPDALGLSLINAIAMKVRI